MKQETVTLWRKRKMEQETITLTKQKVLPDGYSPVLGFRDTQRGISAVKDIFQAKLEEKLSLERVTAPRFLAIGKGLQDDLAGTQVPVSFSAKGIDATIEFVHSLAKWKRYTLAHSEYSVGEGIWTNMDAVRKDEDLSHKHGVYVDQWDWEKIVLPEQRSIAYLQSTVKSIYEAIKETKKEVVSKFGGLESTLPDDITFVHSEDLEEMYPDLTPKQREDAITKAYGAIFLIGIGHPLESGKSHDVRAADYDDWSKDTSAETGKETRGLNGDIIVWDDVRQESLELSSMGIRVDKDAMVYQLDHLGLGERAEKEFHRGVLDEKLPLTIGGGIGQSRVCMYMLEKAHLAEVHSSVWPAEVYKAFEEKEMQPL